MSERRETAENWTPETRVKCEEGERERESGREWSPVEKSTATMDRDTSKPWHPDVISPANRAASTPYPRAPTILLRAKWLIIIIIISYFLRFTEAPRHRGPETTEKQKAREININKS